VGADGSKLVEMWSAIAYGRIPPESDDRSSSRALYLITLKELTAKADVRDRLTASRLLAERGFGQPKEFVEHSGEVASRTTVVHEYHAS